VRTFRCRSVSCNCAVAAREGDDVIVVDMCRDNVPRARFASTVQPQEGTRIERNQNGKVFVVSNNLRYFCTLRLSRNRRVACNAHVKFVSLRKEKKLLEISNW